jgi:chemotaxis protein CheX
MPLDAVLNLQAEDLVQIVGPIFSTMMGIEIEAAEPASPMPAGLMTAAVYLAGGWQGAVLVHCSPQQACEFAGCFLGTPPPSTVTDDVRDVLGELANMIAGNLKCTLRPGIKVSIPSVVDGDGYSLRVCGARQISRTGFATARGPFWLTLMDTQDLEETP